VEEEVEEDFCGRNGIEINRRISGGLHLYGRRHFRLGDNSEKKHSRHPGQT
jgi:hypothetical protein